MVQGVQPSSVDGWRLSLNRPYPVAVALLVYIRLRLMLGGCAVGVALTRGVSFDFVSFRCVCAHSRSHADC
jgi:hypothetical protein